MSSAAAGTFDACAQIAQGAARMGLALDGEATRRLAALLDLLGRWNRVYNLTAVEGPEAWVTMHVLDSLVVLPHLQGQAMLDVGTGAGFPGLPLAIARPDVRWHLLDSNGKKIAFVTQACSDLRLTNVSPVQHRVERWQPRQQFDGIVSRAYSSLGQFVVGSAHLLKDGGRFYAMKGVVPDDELAALPEGVTCENLVPLQVPDLQAARHLVVLQQNDRAG